MHDLLKHRSFINELQIATSRSSGPGGQNVNKVNTKVEIRFDIVNSKILSNQEKHKILLRLKNRINNNNELIITAQNERSQLKNKKIAIEKFHQMISMALKNPKKRRQSIPTKSSIEKRLKQKKQHSDKKLLRKKL